jgi:ABC-type amino acid transport system permease subunit
MLHWVPAPALAFVGARSGGESVASEANTDRCVQSLRAMHALMLAYAGQRRRAALNPVDAHYWKAAGSHALGKAEAIRVGGRFPRLP